MQPPYSSGGSRSSGPSPSPNGPRTYDPQPRYPTGPAAHPGMGGLPNPAGAAGGAGGAATSGARGPAGANLYLNNLDPNVNEPEVRYTVYLSCYIFLCLCHPLLLTLTLHFFLFFFSFSQLIARFRDFGTVIGARLFPVQRYGFLSFDSPESAQRAVAAMNGDTTFSQSGMDVSIKVDKAASQGGARKFRPY